MKTMLLFEDPTFVHKLRDRGVFVIQQNYNGKTMYGVLDNEESRALLKTLSTTFQMPTCFTARAVHF